MIETKKILDYLNKELPNGYIIIMAPSEERATLFAFNKFNPKKWPILEILEIVILKITNKISGGSLN